MTNCLSDDLVAYLVVGDLNGDIALHGVLRAPLRLLLGHAVTFRVSFLHLCDALTGQLTT